MLQKVDTSEQLAVPQSTIPALPKEEGATRARTFASELPRQLLRRQYYDFFKKCEEDGREAPTK